MSILKLAASFELDDVVLEVVGQDVLRVENEGMIFEYPISEYTVPVLKEYLKVGNSENLFFEALIEAAMRKDEGEAI